MLRQNVAITQDLQRINKHNEAMRSQLAELDAQQPPLVVIQAQQQQQLGDLQKLRKLIELLEAKIAKKEQVTSRLRTELAATNQEIERLITAQQQLQQQLQTQPISIEQAKHLKYRHSQLSESLRRIAITKEECNQELWSLEIKQAKQLDQIERLVRRYNQLAEDQHQIEFGATLDQIGNTIRFAMENASESKKINQDKIQAAEDTLLEIEAASNDLEAMSNDLEFELMQQQLKLNDLERQEHDYKQAARKVCLLQAEYDKETQMAAVDKAKFGKQVLSVLDLLVQHKTHIENSIQRIG